MKHTGEQADQREGGGNVQMRVRCRRMNRVTRSVTLQMSKEAAMAGCACSVQPA